METRGDVTNIKGDVSLQFGHDLSAVEMVSRVNTITYLIVKDQFSPEGKG